MNKRGINGWRREEKKTQKSTWGKLKKKEVESKKKRKKKKTKFGLYFK